MFLLSSPSSLEIPIAPKIRVDESIHGERTNNELVEPIHEDSKAPVTPKEKQSKEVKTLKHRMACERWHAKLIFKGAKES